MKYDEFGREIPDQTPVEIPIGFKRPLTLQEEIQRAIRGEMSRQAAAEGMESFEEANDFDTEDVLDDPRSNHEIMEEDEFQARERAMLDRADKEIEDHGKRDGRKGGVVDPGSGNGGDRSGHRDNDAGEKGGKGDVGSGSGKSKAGDDAA